MGWYRKHRNMIHGLMIAVSLLIIFMLAKTNLHNNIACVMCGMDWILYSACCEEAAGFVWG